MTWLPTFAGVLAPTITALFGFAGAMLIRRTSRESNATDSWKALFEGHQQWTKDQLKEQDDWTKERLAERDQKIESLERHVATLEARFGKLEEKYRTAVNYIRQLWTELSTHLKREEIPDPPELISSDL